MGRKRSERGQIVPLVAVLVVTAGAGVIWLGRLGEAAVQRARARTAADAAALAGAAEGEAAAREVAAANGADLVSFEWIGADARVVVRFRSAGATARAARDGEREAGPGVASDAGDVGGVAPALRAALARAQQLLGQPVPVTSGYRSPAAQADLWNRRASNPYPVARPGTSMHERGLAVDVPPSFVDDLVAVAARAGLCHPYPDRDPVHFEVCRGT